MYPTNVHAFDLLYPDQEIAKQAIEKLLEWVGFTIDKNKKISSHPSNSMAIYDQEVSPLGRDLYHASLMNDHEK